MLKIKKSHKKTEEWILYNPDNFALHTHCKSLRVAVVIRDNVTKKRMPKSNNIKMLQSHIRVTKDKKYIQQLKERIKELEEVQQGGCLKYLQKKN